MKGMDTRLQRNDRSSWDGEVLDGILRVNRALHQRGVPRAAAELLYGMQCCLCSGDGLSPATAFRSGGPGVTRRVLSLLGMDSHVDRLCRAGGLVEVTLWPNPHSVRNLWFVESEKKL